MLVISRLAVPLGLFPASLFWNPLLVHPWDLFALSLVHLLASLARHLAAHLLADLLVLLLAMFVRNFLADFLDFLGNLENKEGK